VVFLNIVVVFFNEKVGRRGTGKHRREKKDRDVI
jgi:hypothetical protein